MLFVMMLLHVGTVCLACRQGVQPPSNVPVVSTGICVCQFHQNGCCGYCRRYWL